MTQKDFMELTGENPEDMFGPDWENEVQELGLTAGDIKKNIQRDCMLCEKTFSDDGTHDYCKNCRTSNSKLYING